jgi:hypothetical protein
MVNKDYDTYTSMALANHLASALKKHGSRPVFAVHGGDIYQIDELVINDQAVYIHISEP